MRGIFIILASAAIVVCLWAASATDIFESRPRIVAEGRDPMLAVRASGAVSLLKVDKGDLWLETSFNGADSFEPGVRVNDTPGEVVSHAEATPQMQVRSMHEFYCLWQTRRGGGSDGSVLRFARSLNWGESFSKAIDVDTGSSSQSFFTMNVSPAGVIYVAWLDGRDRGKGRPGTSAVYVARSTNKGVSFETPVRVTLDVCPCCRPAIAFGEGRTVYVSWRGVLEGEVRDIFVGASPDEGATWGKPVRLAEDNWVLNGCPHSGAAMATIGNRLFVAWHAVRDNQPSLWLAYSDDGAKTFSRRIPVSEIVLDPNHPFLGPLPDGRGSARASGSIAGWNGKRPGGHLSLTGLRVETLGLVFQGRPAGKGDGWAPLNVYYREIDVKGRLSPLQTVGHLAGSAAYPVFAFDSPQRIYIAWTEPNQDRKAVVMSRGRRMSAAQGTRRAN
jgi:hypothetical protein